MSSLWPEILISLLQRVSVLSSVLAFLSFAGSIIGTVVYLSTKEKQKDYAENLNSYHAKKNDEVLRMANGWRFVFYAIFAVSLPVSLLPSIDDLWRVRIGLIKLELSSPENVKKGADVIERLGKKLECKYLGCKEDPKEK